MSRYWNLNIALLWVITVKQKWEEHACPLPLLHKRDRPLSVPTGPGGLWLRQPGIPSWPAPGTCGDLGEGLCASYSSVSGSSYQCCQLLHASPSRASPLWPGFWYFIVRWNYLHKILNKSEKWPLRASTLAQCSFPLPSFMPQSTVLIQPLLKA